MKKITVLFLFFLISKLLFSQYNANIKETIEWISGKLNIVNEGGEAYSVKNQKISFNYDKNILIVSKSYFDHDLTYIHYIPVKKVDPDRVAVYYPSKHYLNVQFCILGDEKLIKLERSDDKIFYNKTLILSTNLGYNEIIAEKINKAILHLIKLCGGKTDLF